MLKIVRVGVDGESVTLRLEGRIIGPWVEELRRSAEHLVAIGAAVTLDLAGVSFADHEGIRLLRELVDHKLALANASGFLAERLRAEEQRWIR